MSLWVSSERITFKLWAVVKLRRKWREFSLVFFKDQ